MTDSAAPSSREREVVLNDYCRRCGCLRDYCKEQFLGHPCCEFCTHYAVTPSPRERDDLISRKEAIEALKTERSTRTTNPNMQTRAYDYALDYVITIIAALPPSQPQLTCEEANCDGDHGSLTLIHRVEEWSGPDNESEYRSAPSQPSVESIQRGAALLAKRGNELADRVVELEAEIAELRAYQPPQLTKEKLDELIFSVMPNNARRWAMVDGARLLRDAILDSLQPPQLGLLVEIGFRLSLMSCGCWFMFNQILEEHGLPHDATSPVDDREYPLPPLPSPVQGDGEDIIKALKMEQRQLLGTFEPDWLEQNETARWMLWRGVTYALELIEAL